MDKLLDCFEGVPFYFIEKRNGLRVGFEFNKVKSAVERAFAETGEKYNSKKLFKTLRKNIKNTAPEKDFVRVYSVEQIQNIVETTLMEQGYYETARAYVRYRYLHELDRQKKNDNEFLSMLKGNNEYWKGENSNKNPKLVTVQRDYLAGIASTDIARNYIFPKEVVEAHDAGICHQHDMDYMAQETLHNCCLINLEDMLQNGTVINNVKINKPHRLSTAMTITTQIMASVAANQYGGETITLTHLAPFVRDSYNIYVDKYRACGFDEQTVENFANQDLQKEIEDAVQTFNYQISTLFTLNGQAPFCSIMMYLNETDEYKAELIALIEEFLRQRVEGMPNRQGIKVTQAFPKILYVLQEDNYKPGTPYWWLTQKAIDCSARRLTPDYISEKVMKEIKIDDNGDGQCFPCMGLVIY